MAKIGYIKYANEKALGELMPNLKKQPKEERKTAVKRKGR